MENKKYLLKEYIIESLLLLEDKRGSIKKLGFSKEMSDLFHEIDPKNSYWLANRLKTALPRHMLGSIGDPQKEKILWDYFKQGILKDLEWAKEYNLNPSKTSNLSKKRREYESKVSTEQSGVVIMSFSDGFYWVDLQTSKCSVEAQAMGHCGEDKTGHLWSLRDKKKGSHVTITVTDDGKIVQAKGKSGPPHKKYYKYIVQLLAKENLSVDAGMGDFNIYDLDSKSLKWLYKETGNEIYNVPENMLDYQKLKTDLVNKVESSLKKLRHMSDEIVAANDEEIDEYFKYSGNDIYKMLEAIYDDMRRNYVALLKPNKFNEKFGGNVEQARQSIEELVNAVENYYKQNKDFFG